MKTPSAPLVRASISFPPDIYQSLEGLAKQKKVSLAWVVREAAERYIAEETAEDADGKRRTLGVAQKLTRSKKR